MLILRPFFALLGDPVRFPSSVAHPWLRFDFSPLLARTPAACTPYLVNLLISQMATAITPGRASTFLYGPSWGGQQS